MTVNAAIELGGAVVERSDGAVIVVDREYRADMLHGRTPIGEIVSTITEGDDALQLMAQGVAARRSGIDGRLLFLDLETTGLFGGAGTQAFLVGCAAIDGTSIRVRQFLLPGFEHERALLNEIAGLGEGARRPLHLQRPQLRRAADRNAIHVPPRAVPARRRAAPRHAACGAADVAAAAAGHRHARSGRFELLAGVLEKHIAGLHRVGDVPGYEIPSRFFKFVRTGDARPLEAVMEHNRLDLISLAAVLARAIVLITRGPVGGDDGAGSLRAGARLRARRRATTTPRRRC